MVASNCNKKLTNENFKQFSATIMSYLQSDRYQRGYFHKIWAEYYCLGKNETSEIFCSKFSCPCQLQNLKILLHFGATKTHVGKIFGTWVFLYLKRQSYKYYQEKKSSWAHIIFIHKSYIEIVDKIIKYPKNRTKMKFYIFGKLYLSFASDRLFILSGFIVLQGMIYTG